MKQNFRILRTIIVRYITAFFFHPMHPCDNFNIFQSLFKKRKHTLDNQNIFTYCINSHSEKPKPECATKTWILNLEKCWRQSSESRTLLNEKFSSSMLCHRKRLFNLSYNMRKQATDMSCTIITYSCRSVKLSSYTYCLRWQILF